MEGDVVGTEEVGAVVVEVVGMVVVEAAAVVASVAAIADDEWLEEHGVRLHKILDHPPLPRPPLPPRPPRFPPGPLPLRSCNFSFPNPTSAKRK